jgi:glycosyltransferase involved in cell wall biosynthesis
MAPIELGIVVPAYNAAGTIAATLRRIPRQDLPPAIVLVVDDGSGDGTADAATRAARAAGLRLEVLGHERNRGYGAAQKTGLGRSLGLGCEFHALIHADGQYAPEELPAVLSPLLKGDADVSVGSRVASRRALREGMPLARYVGNRALTWLENRVFGLHFAEYHTGYMTYRTRALREIAFDTLTDRFHFDGEMLLCAGKLGLRVAEVPVSTRFGPDVSSLDPLPYLGEVAGVMARYLRRGYFFQR